jgi:hypothetical protein
LIAFHHNIDSRGDKLKSGENMTITYAKVIFNLQNEILEAPELSDTRKVEMLKNSIKNTIGKTDNEGNK